MKALLEKSRYLVLLIVISSFVATVAATVWGVYETVQVLVVLFTKYKDASSAVGYFVQLMDIFLMAAVLYIFTVAMYELFVDELDLPKWLLIQNFDQLKTILSNLVVLILAVSFLKYFLERNEPLSTLLYGLAVAVVAYALILYRQHGDSHH